LNGGSGANTAAGGVANDTVVVDTAADLVLETAMGGFEDVIRSNIQAYTLAEGPDGHVERVNVNKDVNGGSGGDSFLFDGSALGLETGSMPRVGDFDGQSLGTGDGEDKLVFATGLEAGTFAYIGKAAFDGAGDSQARFAGNGTVEVDIEGDGTVDLAYAIDNLSSARELTALDFEWE